MDRAVNQRNIEDCLLFFTQQENNQFFEIKHPIYNEIKTRAVFSYSQDGNDVYTSNELIFFIDKNNQHPWILLSSLHSFSYIITSTGFFQLSYASMSLSQMNWIYEALRDKEFSFKDITWGYNLRDFTPLHYFYDNLSFFFLIKTNKNIVDKPSFFIPKKYMSKRTTNEVYFIPKCLPCWLFLDKPSWHFINMGKEVYKEAMQDFDKVIQKDNTQYDLTIWLSLTATDWGKRWIEQVEGSVSIINELLKYFPKIKIYFDGLTSFENSNQITPRSTESSVIEKRLLEEIEKKCDTSKINIQSLHKLTIREKICYCSTVDLSINETGSAGIVPSLCCQKPCIYFGNSIYLAHKQMSNPVKYCKIVSLKFLKHDLERKYTDWDGFYPYHIPWQHIYNLAAEILEELSQDGKIKAHNLKMNRLQVPKVELIAKKYDLSLKLKEFEKLFHTKEELENRFLTFLANEFVDLEDKTSNLTQEKANLENALNEAKNTINSLPYKIQTQELNIKKLQVKELEKKLGLKLSKLEPKVVLNLNESLKTSAVARVRNHLAYKRGEAIIVCSKSFLGLLSLPFVIKFIENKHKKEQAALQKILKNNPSLKFVKFEACSDYEQALKLEQCFTYKLGLAFMKARKAWYKGGFVKFYFEAKRLYKEFKKQQKE